MKFCVILGTRPEIIKMCPIIRELERKQLDYFVIHSNQHYSENMDKIFFEELHLPLPKYNLGVGSGNHGEMTGKMLIAIEKILLDEKSDFVFVQGDTNTVLAGALAGSKLGLKICHVEAGLRSYDRTMPEEINRVIADHVSDYLFCPTELEANICKKEAIDNSKIFVVGNTIVDSVYQNIQLANEFEILNKYSLKEKEYILLTMHRPSNADNKEILRSQLDNISELAKQNNLKLIFPKHPRTKNNITKFGLKIPENIDLFEPLGYLETLVLIKNAKVICTDSGGIQEEACILKTPSLTLRENTERPQTIQVGASILVGSNREKLFDSYNKLVNNINWNNPFGNGDTSEKIINILISDKK